MEKCVHMPCSLNDCNYLILQVLQVPLVCYGALHKDQTNKHLLPDCTSHSAFFRLQWHLHDSVWIFKAQNFMFCLFINTMRWKWNSSLNHRQPRVVGYCCTNCKKSQHKSLLRLQSNASHTQAALSSMCADLCLPTTYFLLSQTLPVNWNFCPRQVTVTYWISSKTVSALPKNYWFG